MCIDLVSSSSIDDTMTIFSEMERGVSLTLRPAALGITPAGGGGDVFARALARPYQGKDAAWAAAFNRGSSRKNRLLRASDSVKRQL